MPKLIQSNANTLPTANVNIGNTAGAFGAQISVANSVLGQSISQGGKVLAAKQQRDAFLANERNVSDTMLEMSKQDQQDEAEASEDAEGHVDIVRDRINTTIGKMEQDAVPGTDIEGFRTKLNDVKNTSIARAMKFEVAEKAKFQVKQVQEIFSNNKNIVLLDPSQLDDTVTRQLETIANIKLPEKMKTELIKSTIVDLKMAAIQGAYQSAVLENDFNKAATLLLAIKSGNAGEEIPHDKLNPLINYMISTTTSILQHNNASVRQENTKNRAAQKELEDSTAKEGLDLAQAGDLDLDWVQSQKDRLSVDKYKYFIKRAEGTIDVKTNPELYGELRAIADKGLPVEQAANTALNAGKLEISHFNRLLDISAAKSISGSLPNWYDRGDEFIKEALKVSETNPNLALAESRANALDDWIDWTAKHKNATREEATKEFKAIVEDTKIVPATATATLGAKPRHLVGTRNEPDIGATYKAMIKAFKKGDIDVHEKNRQIRIITLWKQHVDDKAQRKLKSDKASK